MPEVEKDSRPLFALAIATACGVGYVPIAPGTAGSAAGLFIWMLIPGSPVAQAGVIVGMFALGSIAGNAAERYYGRTDPRQVVLDEVMGMLITLFLVPVTVKSALVGFLLFRAFDIIKPYPSNRLERLPGGVGIMADDAMAAIYANIALRALLAFGHLVI